MKKIEKLSIGLLVIAGINWGLWGLFEFNLIYYIFGKEWIDRVIYFLFGVAGIYIGVIWKNWFGYKRR